MENYGAGLPGDTEANSGVGLLLGEQAWRRNVSGIRQAPVTMFWGVSKTVWVSLPPRYCRRVAPRRARAAANVPVIGFLSVGSIDWAVFREALGKTGYVEGQNAAFEHRSAEIERGRLPEAAEVGLMVASGWFPVGHRRWSWGPAFAGAGRLGALRDRRRFGQIELFDDGRRHVSYAPSSGYIAASR
jgi:hypothetical protein